MVLFFVGVILSLGLIALGVIGIIRDSEASQMLGFIFGTFIGLTVLITSISVPLSNLGRLQEMTAFSESNYRNYGITVTQTEMILSQDQIVEEAFIPIEGSIEKVELGQVVAERLVEMRDKVTQYNVDLQKFQIYHDHSLLGFYYPDPGDLKPIIIK